VVRDNRAALIKGARQCIEQIGYARTTARDVASAAGVSLGAISYHFGSKEVLLNEAMAEGFRDWIASFAPIVAESEDQGVDGALRAAIPQFFRLITDNRPLVIGFISAMAQAEHVPELRNQLAEQYRQSRAAAAAIFTSTVGPRLADMGLNATTLSSLVLALVDGIMMQYLLDPTDTPGPDDLLAFYEALLGVATDVPAALPGAPPATPPAA